MRKRIVPNIAVFVLVGSMLSGCSFLHDLLHPKTPPPTPGEIRNTTTTSLDLFSQEKAGKMLTAHLKTATTFSLGALASETASIELLRNQEETLKNEMVNELFSAYRQLDDDDHDRRWLLVDLLAQLRTESALPHLKHISLQRLPPPEQRIETHLFSSTEEEAAIRMAAIRGLGWLAGDGHSQAGQALVEIAKDSPLVSVRSRAVQSYLLAPISGQEIVDYAVFKKSKAYSNRMEVLRAQLPEETVDHVESRSLLRVLPETQR